MQKKKVLLAIGNAPIENYLQNQLENEFYFVGTSTYREGVIKNVESKSPDIVILRELLPGKTNISEIIYSIRKNFPATRIIFLTGTREVGDELLASLVNMQIFDILSNSKIEANKIVDLVRNPNTYQDVLHYQPKQVFDDKKKRILFEAPEVSQVVKQVEKVVYVEKPHEEEPVRTSRLGRKKGRHLDNNVPEETVSEQEEESPKFFGRRRRGRGQASSETEEEKTRELELERQRQEELMRQQEEAKAIELQRKENARQEKIRLKKEKEDQKRREQERHRAEQERLELESKTKFNLSQTEELYMKTLEMKKEMEIIKKNQEATDFMSRELTSTSKQKIITFIGSEHGVGNTQIALNTSIQLATNGYKTLFIELKEKPSTVDYLYRLHRNIENGLEIALLNLTTKDYRGVNKSIVRMKDVIDRTPESDIMLNNYKMFPKNLDFLYFSPSYTEVGNDLVVGNPDDLKELFYHLIFEAGYHYIILDADIDKSNPYTEVALRFAQKVFYTLTQDICHIGNSVRHVKDISDSINIKEKLYYVVNKYEDADMTKNGITDWLQLDSKMPLLTIPNHNKEFINANYVGLPVLYNTKQKDLKKAFNEIAQYIQKMM